MWNWKYLFEDKELVCYCDIGNIINPELLCYKSTLQMIHKKATLFLKEIVVDEHHNIKKGSSPMNTQRIQDFVMKGKEVFVGFEDSKKTWKIAVRCEKMLIHQVSMEAKYPVLIQYLRNKFSECTIHLVYEAGFKGFNLYDQLTDGGIDCVVVPPHLVTEPKVNGVKTDKRDARRLALILENNDVPSFCNVSDRERREDRQISRTFKEFQALKELPLCEPLKISRMCSSRCWSNYGYTRLYCGHPSVSSVAKNGTQRPSRLPGVCLASDGLLLSGLYWSWGKI